MKPPHGRLSEAQADCCLAPGRGALFDSRPPRRFSSRKTILRSSSGELQIGPAWHGAKPPARRQASRRGGNSPGNLRGAWPDFRGTAAVFNDRGTLIRAELRGLEAATAFAPSPMEVEHPKRIGSAVNVPLINSEHHRSVLLDTICVSKKPSPFCPAPGDGFCRPDMRWAARQASRAGARAA